jgi:thiol-disulfide isomerase/thioredoxin
VEHWDLARIRGEMKLRRGRPFLIHLWASWCGPCLEELPSVESFARKARSHGIAVVSMSLDSAADSDERVPTALRERAPSLTPVIADFDDPATFGSLFSRTSVPTSLPRWEGSIPALFAFDSEGVLHQSILELAEPAELDRLLERLIRDDSAAVLRARARKKPHAEAGSHPPLAP